MPTSADRKELLQRELDRMLGVIVDKYHPAAVYLYGSAASGTVSEWSDLDLVIIKETDEPFFDRIAAVLKIARPNVGADICVYTPSEWNDLVRSRRFAREEIQERGKCLYAA